jgi:FtsZ-interacting cell division protein ZipA
LGETQAPFAGDDDAQVQHEFGDLGYLTPDHHLADKALVDVEIRKIHRESDSRSALTKTGADTESEPHVSPTPDPEKPPQMTVVLTVMAPPHRPFSGSRILAITEELQFRLGASGLFERFPDGEADADAPVFSLAHLREPGSFDLQTLHELRTPGLLLFMNLPGPLEGTQALNLLVLTADQWAQKLAGVICDGRRNRNEQSGVNASARRSQRSGTAAAGMDAVTRIAAGVRDGDFFRYSDAHYLAARSDQQTQ